MTNMQPGTYLVTIYVYNFFYLLFLNFFIVYLFVFVSNYHYHSSFFGNLDYITMCKLACPKASVDRHSLCALAVIGFETGDIEVMEYPPQVLEISLLLFTPTNALSTLILASKLQFTVGVNNEHSTATFGNLQ